ncbi:MAG TPA: HD domain-containing phosphohydrolase, partial [Actinomycetota bacterium]
MAAGLRLAELLVGLSTTGDIGMGLPPGEAARSAVLGTSLARAVGAPDADVSDVLYAALLQHIGCTAYSHEAALLFPDEVVVKRAGLRTNFARPVDVFRTYVPWLLSAGRPAERVRTVVNALARSRSVIDGYSRSNCEVASATSRRLGLGDGVQRALLDIFEWWNGRGAPKGLRGEQIPLATRITHVATYGALFHRLGGLEAAVDAVRTRAGGYLDPGLAAAFCARAPDLIGEMESADVAIAGPAAEPAPVAIVNDDDVDGILRTFGEVVDLKAPFLYGHSGEVTELARAAAGGIRMSDADVAAVARAALVHDLGRTAIPGGIWEREGPLRSDEWDRVRLHPYHTERILVRVP